METSQVVSVDDAVMFGTVYVHHTYMPPASNNGNGNVAFFRKIQALDVLSNQHVCACVWWLQVAPS